MVRNLTLLLILAFAWAYRPYYVGDWKDGRFHGNGELVDRSGGKYIGEFEKGKEAVKGDKNILTEQYLKDCM